MIDELGTFSRVAVMEIRKETNLRIRTSGMIDLSQPAQQYPSMDEQNLRSAMYPNAGGLDEFVVLYLWKKVGHFIRKFKVWERLSMG